MYRRYQFYHRLTWYILERIAVELVSKALHPWAYFDGRDNSQILRTPFEEGMRPSQQEGSNFTYIFEVYTERLDDLARKRRRFFGL